MYTAENSLGRALATAITHTYRGSQAAHPLNPAAAAAAAAPAPAAAVQIRGVETAAAPAAAAAGDEAGAVTATTTTTAAPAANRKLFKREISQVQHIFLQDNLQQQQQQLQQQQQQQQQENENGGEETAAGLYAASRETRLLKIHRSPAATAASAESAESAAAPAAAPAAAAAAIQLGTAERNNSLDSTAQRNVPACFLFLQNCRWLIAGELPQ
ncbi:hypothetical protein EAH_00032770 [Eimeria acervulina]|uniref:Uncharacterized protein n=1 Tax=Eimeria acervulina TaxID=5801 RepID=U6GDM2_EIMAC|nr:hypothetical protein EAH_00032770 [Eimeria acervulina]CDI78366.1 hypothetical protein EAH_00032770 [Eimeria acervulina]